MTTRSVMRVHYFVTSCKHDLGLNMLLNFAVVLKEIRLCQPWLCFNNDWGYMEEKEVGAFFSTMRCSSGPQFASGLESLGCVLLGLSFSRVSVGSPDSSNLSYFLQYFLLYYSSYWVNREQHLPSCLKTRRDNGRTGWFCYSLQEINEQYMTKNLQLWVTHLCVLAIGRSKVWTESPYERPLPTFF